MNVALIVFFGMNKSILDSSLLLADTIVPDSTHHYLLCVVFVYIPYRF